MGLPENAEVEEFAKLLLSCATPERAAALLEQLQCLLRQNAEAKSELADAVGRFLENCLDGEGQHLSQGQFKSLREWIFDSAGLNVSHAQLSEKFKALKSNCELEHWGDAKDTCGQIVTLLKWGANPNAFENKGIKTAQGSRSLLHQLVENQSKVTPSSSSGGNAEQREAFQKSLDTLIDQWQSQGCDIVAYEEIKKSSLVVDVKELLNGSEQPVLFYGFEAMQVEPKARGSTRRSKLGLDGACEQKGKIASLLDGIDFEEILRYGDRKLERMFGDGTESFEKTIKLRILTPLLINTNFAVVPLRALSSRSSVVSSTVDIETRGLGNGGQALGTTSQSNESRGRRARWAPGFYLRRKLAMATASTTTQPITSPVPSPWLAPSPSPTWTGLKPGAFPDGRTPR